MNNSNNQIRNKLIKQYPKTDRQKLVGIRDMIGSKYPPVSVTLEPFMLFTKGEDEYQGWHNDLRKDQVEEFIVHPPDLVLRFSYKHQSREIFFELDGPIHDIKTKKTSERNRRYELNSLEYFVINETDLKFKLEIPKTRPLTQEQRSNSKIDACWWRRLIWFPAQPSERSPKRAEQRWSRWTREM